jgi:hypothetical protein
MNQRQRLGDSAAVSQQALQSALDGPHRIVGRGFAQTFGLHPAIALLTIVVDHMLFAKEGLLAILAVPTGGITLMLALAVSCSVGCALGVITYLAQRAWFGDNSQSAFIKAIMLAFLTAIPTPIPAVVYGPAGMVGLFRKKH